MHLDRSGILLPELYRFEVDYGWSAGMRAITLRLLAMLNLPAGPVLELGCGGGQLLSKLVEAFPDRQIAAVDLSPLAISIAAENVPQTGSLVQAELQSLPVPKRTFALVLALDVFDQRQIDLGAALRESWRVLIPGGRLMLRVSAHPWLEGAHDVAFNTGRRYRQQNLIRALGQAGFELVRVTYANTIWFPPIAALRLLQRWRLLPFMESLYRRQGLNHLLAVALHAESSWLGRANLPIGLSLYVTARKTEEPLPATQQ